MNTYTSVIADLREPTRKLRREIPDTWSAFSALHGAAMAEGAFPVAFKELVALAIAVAKRCDGCVAYHDHFTGTANVTTTAAA
jgi:AhpD family alkylhydroperoxidase